MRLEAVLIWSSAIGLAVFLGMVFAALLSDWIRAARASRQRQLRLERQSEAQAAIDEIYVRAEEAITRAAHAVANGQVRLP